MQLTLYKTSDSRNVINKTLNSAFLVNVRLFKDFDVINPTIKLSNLPVNIVEYNYIHIPGLNRYYFIDSIELINSSIYSLICSCDLLETYKAEILVNSCTYRRPIKAGDYGEVEINSTGKNIISEHESDTELTINDNILFSTLRG